MVAPNQERQKNKKDKQAEKETERPLENPFVENKDDSESSSSSSIRPRLPTPEPMQDPSLIAINNLAKMFEQRFATIENRLDGYTRRGLAEREVNRENEPARSHRSRDPRERPADPQAQDYYSHNGNSSFGSQRRSRRTRVEPDRMAEQLANYKMRVPQFFGKNDPDAYLDWERKTEMVFNSQNYQGINCVKIAASEFYEYALSWWDQTVTARTRSGGFPIDSWYEMKRVMRLRFVPTYYHRELHAKLRKLTQGSRSVEEYHQELEVLLMRADIVEEKEAAMSRFLGGLNREIADVVEMSQYNEMEEMLHKAVLVEKQLKRKGSM